MFYLIKQLYKNFKLVHKIKKIITFKIFFNIILIIVLISNLYIILYNLAIKILHIFYLYFIKDQYIILILLIILTK